MFAFDPLGWVPPQIGVTLFLVAVGVAALGGVSGVIGTFAVVRRQSLQGDAISHAALPGLAIAFILGAKSPLLLVLGAAASGWIAMTLVAGVVRNSRIPFDSALAGALAVFFGLGLALLVFITKTNLHEASTHALDRYLFGQTAYVGGEEVAMILGLGGAAVLVAVLGWKEFKLVSFDRDFAASLGLPTRLLDVLLTALVVTAVVIGLRAVGVVLTSAFLVAPATAARQWTDRLGRMALIAAGIGAAAGATGAVIAHHQNLPTGPTIVLVVTGVVVLSLLVAPHRGLLWRIRRQSLPWSARSASGSSGDTGPLAERADHDGHSPPLAPESAS